MKGEFPSLMDFLLMKMRIMITEEIQLKTERMHSYQGPVLTQAASPVFCFNLPPESSDPPEYLRWQIFDVLGRRRRRRRGKRAGIATRIKLALAAGCSTHTVLAHYAIDVEGGLRVFGTHRINSMNHVTLGLHDFFRQYTP
ncbi:unnamed protein product [Leuciscus chuanchicus]